MNNKHEDLTFDNTATTSINGSPILGRLTGPCADIIHPTRNGRKYSQELWEKVFKDPIVLEYFNCGGIFGELGHPADRDETDMEKIAICMPEIPYQNDKGELIGSWDILNTPNGRILKCLCDYGYKMGISSRGSGDTYIDSLGEEAVDPETYSLTAFDVVLLPAVKSARLSYMKESLDNKENVSLKKALTEALSKSSDDERKVMTETLHNLNIAYDEDTDIDEVTEAPETNTDVADNVGTSIVEELQEALKENVNLQTQIKELQEKLSVSYTKETRQATLIEKQQAAISHLTEASHKVTVYSSQVSKLNEKIDKFKQIVKTQSETIEQLNEQLNSSKKSLQENIEATKKLTRVSDDEKIKMHESINKVKQAASVKENALNEQIAVLKKDSAIKNEEYKTKLAESTTLVSKYKKIASAAVDKYINLQAVRLGIDAKDIKNQLAESYSFEDIDRACERLQDYQVSINTLPFATNARPVKMKVVESTQVDKPATDLDDDVDFTLMKIAGV